MLAFILSSVLGLTTLQNNYQTTPSGMDPAQRPTFSWIIESSKNNTVQSAYRLSVSRDGKVVYDSGKVSSDQSVGVKADFDLQSACRYDWKVTVWDNHGSSAKASSHFGTGLRSSDWKAKWLTAPDDPSVEKGTVPAYFDGKWTIPSGKRIRRATLFATAHGLYEVSLNNARVGDYYLTPGWTSYQNRLQYQAYDVTGLLRRGGNDISVVVAGGWHSGGMGWGKREKRFRYGDADRSLLMQMQVEYSDGSSDIFCTDDSWQVGTGEVTMASIYDGQTINRNVKPVRQKAIVSGYSYDNLVATECEPVSKHLTRKAESALVTPKGEKVIDFGQNLVGWEKVRLHGHKGDTVVIRHAEVLDKDGNFYTTNLRVARATSTYVLSEKAESAEGEVFEPTLTFYGFRYISVDGLSGDLNPADFEAEVVYSGFESIGHFACSDPVINQLQSNIEWGFHGNFVDIPTDCPQRDERLGWTGDTQVFCRTAAFLGATEPFYSKWLRDLYADQRESGAVARVVPDIFPKSQSRIGSSGWADAATFVPWYVYMAYGDENVLKEQYPSMKLWVKYMMDQTDDTGLWIITDKLHFGDWLSWKKSDDPEGFSAVTSKRLVAQCFYAGSLDIMIKSARVLGHSEDAAMYEAQLQKVKKAFCDEYVTARGMVGSDTQTAYVLALHFEMLPENLRAQALDRLVENIERYKWHITTGFLGTPYICEVLSDGGRSDVAYKLLMQKTCPSWIYPISKGATTIWERWDSIQPDGSIIPGMNSFNHYSYGCIGDWLYRNVAGIRETSPGYKTIEICPCAGGGFSWAEASTRTPYGKVSAKWQADSEGTITSLVVDIPVNTSAVVWLPRKAGQAPLRYDLGSGHYTL